jgi:flavorubredoxin
MGKKALDEHFEINLDVTVVDNDTTLDLGGLHLNFKETRMLHWPDSMFTYLPERGILFTQDAFGMHLASNERFEVGVKDYILEYEAAKYYANIILPYSRQVVKLIDDVKHSDLDIRMLACDHGPIWTEKIDWIINSYDRWGKQEPTEKILIIYDTMWRSTEKMARAISDGVIQSGMKSKMMPLSSHHRSDIAYEVLECGGLVVGSPTLNNNMFPTVADNLWYLKGLKPQNLVGAAFGSYGWSGEGDKQVRGILEEMKIDLVDENMRVKYVPTKGDLVNCAKLGIKLAEMLKEKIG